MKSGFKRPEIIVEHDAPMPLPHRRSPPFRYPWHRLKRIGDSFFVTVEDAEMRRLRLKSVQQAAAYQRHRSGRKYVVRASRSGVRCWLAQYAPDELEGERTIEAGFGIIFKATDLCQLCARPRDAR